MPLTQLTDLTGYEVSLVPMGANKKRRFLVTKEDDGELSMDELLEQILKEGLKDEEAVDKVAKNLGLNEEETKVMKAIMKMVGAEKSPLSKEKLMKALEAMGVKKEDDDKDGKEGSYTEKECDETAKESDSGKDDQVNKEGKRGGDPMPGKVPVQKQDGSWDLTGVDEKIRPALEVVCKSNEQLAKALETQKTENKTLADKLKAEKDARVLKEFEEKAKLMGHVGEDASKLAKVLKAAYDANPENGAAVEEILKAANAKLESSAIFAEAGVSGSSGEVAGSAWAKIEKAADALSKEKSVSHAEAIDLVLKRHPELYQEYQQEKRRAV